VLPVSAQRAGLRECLHVGTYVTNGAEHARVFRWQWVWREPFGKILGTQRHPLQPLLRQACCHIAPIIMTRCRCQPVVVMGLGCKKFSRADPATLRSPAACPDAVAGYGLRAPLAPRRSSALGLLCKPLWALRHMLICKRLWVLKHMCRVASHHGRCSSPPWMATHSPAAVLPLPRLGQDHFVTSLHRR
jgi:hypothetical protein